MWLTHQKLIQLCHKRQAVSHSFWEKSSSNKCLISFLLLPSREHFYPYPPTSLIFFQCPALRNKHTSLRLLLFIKSLTDRSDEIVLQLFCILASSRFKVANYHDQPCTIYVQILWDFLNLFSNWLKKSVVSWLVVGKIKLKISWFSHCISWLIIKMTSCRNKILTVQTSFSVCVPLTEILVFVVVGRISFP